MSEQEWDRVMAVNLRGLFVGSREAARRMIAAGKGGVSAPYTVCPAPDSCKVLGPGADFRN